MKPNIFNISTNELSQDGFITWLLQWGDKTCAELDKLLNDCAVDFITTLLMKAKPDFSEDIIKVKAERQHQNIDIWAEINFKYLIIIEDKTFTGQHSNQLANYKSIATKWCADPSRNFEKPICIYLKTGNESNNSLLKIEEEGFYVFNRLDFISILNSYDIKNNIFVDFKERLQWLESLNNEWENKIINLWESNDWQGFYQYLEKVIDISWNKVNNQNGGFWKAGLSWAYLGSFPVFLQIEEYKLCIKVSTDPKEKGLPENWSKSEIRNFLSNFILTCAKELNLSQIKKPARFGNGDYMTIGVIEKENWLGDPAKVVNKFEVVENIQSFKKFLADTITIGNEKRILNNTN